MTRNQPNHSGDQHGASACPTCGRRASTGLVSAPCDRCCTEFRQRLRIGADTPHALGTRMAREARLLIALVLGLAGIAVATMALASHYHGAVPQPLAVLTRSAHIVVMACGIAICLRADASARALPRAPAPVSSLRLGNASSVEDLVPGAAPSIVALLLPWAIGHGTGSMLLAAVDLALALATVTAATVIIYKSQLLSRMRIACQSAGSERAADWARSSPARWALVAALTWIIAVAGGCSIAGALGEGPNAIVDRAVDAGLAVGAILWFIAFRAAQRECKHLQEWIGTGTP